MAAQVMTPEDIRRAVAAGVRAGLSGFNPAARILDGLEERGSGMRDLHELDEFRETGPHVIDAFGDVGDGTCGMFRLPSPVDAGRLLVIASAGEGWDHVSVSRPDRCPVWIEMEAIKRRFFRPGETAMQLHVAEARHINRHPYCLHLWRPHVRPIPLPPGYMV